MADQDNHIYIAANPQVKKVAMQFNQDYRIILTPELAREVAYNLVKQADRAEGDEGGAAADNTAPVDMNGL